jgi:hypothetical protein
MYSNNRKIRSIDSGDDDYNSSFPQLSPTITSVMPVSMVFDY